MKLEKKYIPWILVAAVVLIIFSQQNTIPKEAVSDVNGVSCKVNKDCVCMGTFNTGTKNVTNFGIGVGSCVNCGLTKNQNLTGCTGFNSGLHCDTGYCIDLVPIVEWTRDNPLHWLKSNTIWLLVIVGGLIIFFMLPKH